MHIFAYILGGKYDIANKWQKHDSSSVIKRNSYWYTQQYGWILKGLFWTKEGSQIKALIVCFNLPEVVE